MCCCWPKIHKSVTLPKQSWPYGALVEAKCWLAACCSWVEDILLHNDSWPQWDGQHWHGEAEAPGDARGSLVLLSVWALLALCLVILNKKNKTINTGRWVTVQWWRWHGGRAARAAWDAALVLAVQWEWKRFNTRTQWWQYVRLIGRISLSFFFYARGAHKALLNLDTATKDFNTLTVFLLLLFRTSSMLAIWEAAVSVKPWTYIRGRDGEHSDQVP